MKRAFPLLVLTAALAVPATARAETTQSDFVLVRTDEIVTEDLIAAGNSIQVDGRIEGDLLAAAFERIVVNGEVTGDVIAISGRLEINGVVGGSVRALAGSVHVDGVIGDDLALAAWNATSTAVSEVSRDVLVFGRSGAIEGRIGRDLTGRFSRLTINGDIDGSVEVTVARLTIGPATRVAGELGYRSREDAVIEAADTGGEVIHRTPLRPNIRVTALMFLSFSVLSLSVLAGGLIATRYWPERLERAIAAAGRIPPTWLAGVGLAFSPLLVLGIFAGFLALSPSSAALPLGVVFVPLSLGLLGLVLLGALAGLVPLAGSVGRVVREGNSLPASVFVGWLVLVVLLFIPVARWLIPIVGMPVGLGSWLAKGKEL